MEANSNADRTNWQDVPLVFVYRPACPQCGCERYIRLRTYDGGDGSSSQRRVCTQCSNPYIAVFEPLPESGKTELDTL